MKLKELIMDYIMAKLVYEIIKKKKISIKVKIGLSFLKNTKVVILINVSM